MPRRRLHHFQGLDPHVAALLVPGEGPVAAYKTLRNTAIFTTKRLIGRDAQGLKGKKVEVYSLPFSAVNMWSSENAGTFDVNAKFQVWTRASQVKTNLCAGIDVRKLNWLIARAVLGT
ncbi:PH domain-containing protein [Micrococcus sp. GbtcB5]|uniref:PH domain-containing protein n=1 Tax=Micrococcus sp. GbtcB5 TaxID=2824750 RepID=UPI001C30F32C|nr:PH domain-containing protein [Micrococcus sp. GbtcB5]